MHVSVEQRMLHPFCLSLGQHALKMFKKENCIKPVNPDINFFNSILEI